ncbi:MAG: hypothetical protein ACQEQL_00300 [Pseudomonadota bacterium]
MKFAFTHPLHLMIGLIIWSLWFITIYGGLSVACQITSSPTSLGPLSWINIVLLIFTVLIFAVLLTLSFRCWRSPKPTGKHIRQHAFTLHVSAALYLAAAIATLAIGLPTLLLPPCL